MTWKEIRQKFPHQWLLVEAIKIKAQTENEMRIWEDIAILNTFSDSVAAMRSYGKIHREEPKRELFVFHTDRENLDIHVRRWAATFMNLHISEDNAAIARA